ncbi:5'-nucleotidase C-terminal domain-containing protein [Pseudomonas sp. ISL-84]|nr:5'-nucleotidase C-terminal domain-containing protein [Pseudomonas sp. ISL-84]
MARVVKELTLIQQNDTHGSIELHHEAFWKDAGMEVQKVGGFARIGKYVKDVKKQKENVLFLDGGDLFHGTLPLVASKGEAILPALKLMELDGFVPGNWDYAYGKEQLQNLAGELPFPAIACNVNETDKIDSFITPYLIKELQGVKAGIIGLTYPFTDETMPDSFSEGFEFSKGIKEVQEIIESIKDQTDIMILISHMGLPLDVELASKTNGIDVILSGHTHDRIASPITRNNTLIVQSGASSSFLGQLDLKIADGKIESYGYNLIPLDETYEEDSQIAEAVRSILAPYEKQREETVGETKTLLHRMTLNEAPMDKLITDAYLHAFEADIAFSHGWRYGTPIPEGKVSLYDVHTIIPTNPELFLMEVEGQYLIKALEKNLEQVFSADPFGQKGGYILRSSGLFMTFKPYNPKGNRIQELLVNGDPINPHKRYKVVGGGEQLFKGMNNKKEYQGIHAIDVIKSFLAEKAFTYEEDRKIINV